MIIVLVTGIVFGLVQGFLVAYMDIQPFIVTLAGMFFARGMTAIISKDMISITNETFMAWAKIEAVSAIWRLPEQKWALWSILICILPL